MHTVDAYAFLPWRGPMEKPDTACKMIVGVRGGVKGETESGGSVHDTANRTGRVRAWGKPRAKARGKARAKRS